MKFVIAPDKFKGSLTGFEFCDAVEAGLSKVFTNANIIKLPLADGGDGTIDVVNNYIKGQNIKVNVKDPLMRTIRASYLYSTDKNIAFIEMAEASGLKLLQGTDRNCMITSSFGTGELIVDALKKGAKEIILGIGGSATNDGGMGLTNALGFQFLDKNSRNLEPIGKNLGLVETIDDSQINPLLKDVKFKVACDVSNPFYGEDGAAVVYGKQKGASIVDIETLDKGLHNFAKVIKSKYDVNLQKTKGSGAAGGIGGGSMVFLNANLVSGIDLIKDLSKFDSKIEGADWIITGEGKLDEQTLFGKTINGILTSAKLKNIPVAAFCGAVELSIEKQEELGLSYVTSILRKVIPLEEAMNSSYDNLVNASYNFAKVLS